METEIYQYTIPTWSICAIEYGDYSGLTDEDIQILETFLADLPQAGGCFSYSEEEYFSRYPSFGLACTCVEADYVLLTDVE